MNRIGTSAAVLLAVGATAAPAVAQLGGWQFGAVLDAAATSQALALGKRDQGLGLGHSDVIASGPLGSVFDAQGIVAVHSHEGKLEAELENLWLQTRTLPWGLQLRAGRFASQIAI